MDCFTGKSSSFEITKRARTSIIVILRADMETALAHRVALEKYLFPSIRLLITERLNLSHRPVIGRPQEDL